MFSLSQAVLTLFIVFLKHIKQQQVLGQPRQRKLAGCWIDKSSGLITGPVKLVFEFPSHNNLHLI